jgi:alkylated DNA nucleotide flippase Atl1
VSGAGRKRAAIVINNKQIDTILLTQLSEEDAVVLETRVDKATLIIASMYFHINRPIDIDLQKMQAILTHAKGVGTIFGIDSNARSTSWHDVLTKKRGKSLEEFLLSRQLHITNEESCCTTFRTCRGASNTDLTIINNQAIDFISDWAVHDQEICSDHIIKYGLGNGNVTFRPTEINMVGVRYRVTQRDIAKFQGSFIHIMEQLLSGTNKAAGGVEKLDETLRQRAATAPNME